MSKQDLLHLYDSGIANSVNQALAQAVLALPDESYLRKSHYFHGRYENIYVNEHIHPALSEILQLTLEKAGIILQLPKQKLHLGFWLNIMHKGDVTTLHSHDDDDELLSAVYYIQVPEESGLFRIHDAGEVQEIKPVTGRFMFFDPSLPHEVSVHQNEIPRLSIGINIGMLG